MPHILCYIIVRIFILYRITAPFSDVRLVVLPSNTGRFLMEIVGSVMQTSTDPFLDLTSCMHPFENWCGKYIISYILGYIDPAMLKRTCINVTISAGIKLSADREINFEKD